MKTHFYIIFIIIFIIFYFYFFVLVCSQYAASLFFDPPRTGIQCIFRVTSTSSTGRLFKQTVDKLVSNG